jgi:hypothetical protein
MKGLLAEQERQHPQIFANLLAAMRPLMALQTSSPLPLPQPLPRRGRGDMP